VIHEADVVVAGVGMAPDVGVATSSGIEIGNGIIVSERCETSVPDVFAAGGQTPMPREIAEVHALARLEEGFDLGQVVFEFTVLRDTITRLWAELHAEPDLRRELRVLNQAIDTSVSASIDRYSRAFSVFYLRDGFLVVSSG
jgi:hypothetical protein